jgi:CRISPR-associated protein Cas5d
MGYGIAIRVRGDYALFTRLEMKVERVSYDIITPSAARGVIEAIYWKPAIRWVIDKIHVLNEIKFTNIRRNEVGDEISVSTAKQVMKGAKKPLFLSATANRQQRSAMVLKNVDYIIEAHFEEVEKNWGEWDTKEGHYNIVLRRLRKGQHYHAPYLGTREFGAKVELLENGKWPTSALTGEEKLGWMLYDLDFSNPKDIQPRFFEAVMQDGVIDLSDIKLRGVRR